MRIYLHLILNKNYEIPVSENLKLWSIDKLMELSPKVVETFSKIQIEIPLADEKHILTLGNENATYQSLQVWLKEIFYPSGIANNQEIIESLEEASFLAIYIDSSEESDTFDISLTGTDIKALDEMVTIIVVDY